jgi:hemolysin III
MASPRAARRYESCMTLRFKEPVSGFTHLAGLVLAVLGVGWLSLRGGAGPGVLVYGASLVALYAASSAYHLVPSGKRVARALRALDHLAIFFLVAGTCTPVLCHALEGTTRIAMLSAVWGAAALGIALRASWRRAPRALYTALYVAMGWMVVLRWTDLRRALPFEVVALIVAGGVVYTLGAVVYALRRPNPFPRVFGFHEIWHLFVLGGSALHFAAVAALA